jgi:hypothetical protein
MEFTGQQMSKMMKELEIILLIKKMKVKKAEKIKWDQQLKEVH